MWVKWKQKRKVKKVLFLVSQPCLFHFNPIQSKGCRTFSDYLRITLFRFSQIWFTLMLTSIAVLWKFCKTTKALSLPITLIDLSVSVPTWHPLCGPSCIWLQVWFLQIKDYQQYHWSANIYSIFDELTSLWARMWGCNTNKWPSTMQSILNF